jgi:hypothetical protein
MTDRYPARTALATLALLFSLVLLARPAAAWDIRGDAPAEDFRDFHHSFSLAVYDYPRHGAAALGLTGFDIYVDAAVDRGFTDEDFAQTVIDGDMTGDALVFARVGARKGLPGGINLGLSYGEALQGDVKLVSGELQYALLKGGVLEPALSIRLTGSRTLDAGTYDLDQYGAELLFSKGFTVLTPYIGAGFVYSDGSLKRPAGGSVSDDFTQTVVYGGLTLNLLLPKITVEVEKADRVQGAVRVAFGI